MQAGAGQCHWKRVPPNSCLLRDSVRAPPHLLLNFWTLGTPGSTGKFGVINVEKRAHCKFKIRIGEIHGWREMGEMSRATCDWLRLILSDSYWIFCINVVECAAVTSSVSDSIHHGEKQHKGKQELQSVSNKVSCSGHVVSEFASHLICWVKDDDA